ncbi:Ig-like domain-containing protein [Pseudomonas fluorescens]|uniref:BIG2 domain-containing protein n=1 Tax=Pseudomonas fluorescens TaxID=294 RepID=A0A5E6QSH2_PSEFL|nr:Ig-like domain-containing protein [Pseudomonas fluorescens]VVM58583.1 hypothetical protein PS624_01171 [Pseudomonas fluorescens]
MANPNKPLLLAELGIPGRSKDPVSKDPDVWGINIAAALGNFPLHGLQCQAGPWGNMASGDRLTIFWGTGLDAGGKTVLKDEVGTQLRMFVPSRHMVDGQFAVSYVVKPLGGTDQPSEVMQVLVKLTRPGGHDENGDGGHSKLIMIIPQDILDGGIDKEIAEKGVKISIGKADGTPPYPYAAAGDICRVSWGGIFVLSEPLTQEQAEGKAPIIISITEAIIKEAGDAPGVAVVFEVYDKVFNRSEDWSPEQRVVVAVDATRLIAPLLKETLNNVLDVDQLGDADGTVQIIATDTASFEIGDIPFIRIKGTPVEGAPIDLEVEGAALTSVPSIIEIKAPNAVLRQLAKSQITLSYRLKKADGTADLKSKSQFIRAIGEVQRLAAPIMLDEDSGALDPTLAQVRLEIPFDKSFAEGQVLQPIMLGTTPGLKPYLPVLPARLITRNDIIAEAPLAYSIDGKHLAPVNGGTAEFYYQQLIADAVLATLDKYAATRAIRESIHTDILQVGEPRLELPEPVVAGVVDGVLPADTAGTTLTVPYTETVKGDEVFIFWIGSITGEYPDSIKLNEFTAGKQVPFTIPAEVIKGNEGGTVIARYEIKRADGGTSYAEPLEFSVGVALDLKEPKIKQAPNDTSLDPLDAQSALTAVIDYDGMLIGDKIVVRWIGAPGTLPAGSDTTDPWPVTTLGQQDIPIAVSVIAFNLDKSITLDYTVTRGTQDPKDSRPRTLAVSQLRVDLSHSPKIIQAADGGDGTELDVSTLTAAATLRGGFWPHIAAGQRVWKAVAGIKKDDTEYKHEIWTGPANAVSATWITQGYADTRLPLVDMQALKHLSELRVTFNATPDRSTDVNLALSFPVRTYTVKNIVEVPPTITSVKGSPSGDDIPHGSPTVETAVTLRGTATPYTKIDLANNGVLMPNTEIQVDPEGEWTFQLTGLVAENTYKLSARRKDGILSNTRDVVVVALVVPTLGNVLDDKGVEVPDGETTVSTDLILKGTASLGQKINIRDGTGSGSATRGTATAGLTTGLWECPITVPLGARRLYAEACYPSNPLYSNVRNLTVTEDIAPTIESVKGTVSGEEIPEGSETVERDVTLSGEAANGQRIEIFDLGASIDTVSVDASGKWMLPIAALSVTTHSFNAKALYGSGIVSAPRTLRVNVAPPELIVDESDVHVRVQTVSIAGSGLPWSPTQITVQGSSIRNAQGGVRPYTYSSSNPEIATVDSQGLIRAIKTGNAIVTVSDDAGQSKNIKVFSDTNLAYMRYNPTLMTESQYQSWCRSIGGREADHLISLAVNLQFFHNSPPQTYGWRASSLGALPPGEIYGVLILGSSAHVKMNRAGYADMLPSVCFVS